MVAAEDLDLLLAYIGVASFDHIKAVSVDFSELVPLNLCQLVAVLAVSLEQYLKPVCLDVLLDLHRVE